MVNPLSGTATDYHCHQAKARKPTVIQYYESPIKHCIKGCVVGLKYTSYIYIYRTYEGISILFQYSGYSSGSSLTHYSDIDISHRTSNYVKQERIPISSYSILNKLLLVFFGLQHRRRTNNRWFSSSLRVIIIRWLFVVLEIDLGE
jgi:hypothetical protein